MYTWKNNYIQNNLINVTIHHSSWQRDESLEQVLDKYNASHKTRFFDKYEVNWQGQEIWIGKWPYIWYHFSVAWNWDWNQNRNYTQVWYTDSNWTRNNQSLAICVNGNFENEKPTDEQLKTLKELLLKIRKDNNNLKLKINWHKDFSATACPWQNLYILLKEIENECNSDIQLNTIYNTNNTDMEKQIESKFQEIFDDEVKFKLLKTHEWNETLTEKEMKQLLEIYWNRLLNQLVKVLKTYIK